LSGDNNPNGPDLGPLGKFFASDISVGTHTVAAVPWDSAGCSGNAGCALTKTFTAHFTGCPGYVSGFSLYTSRSPTAIGPITNGAVFCKGKTRGSLSIGVETVSCAKHPITKVAFSGSFSGSSLQKLNVGKLPVGVYTVTGLPSSGVGMGIGMTVSFEIVAGC
jgi:hypothetical protein